MNPNQDVLSGTPYPLGATWDGKGTNFALFSQNATRVELCLFGDGPRGSERRRIPMRWHRGPVWHCYVPGAGPGTLYGYRVDGPYRPDEGHRFNPAKLLMDPYAKAIQGDIDWNAPVYGYRRGRHASDLSTDGRDDAWGKPRSVVVDTSFDWQGDQRLQTPWSDTIVYEVHLKGFTALHPEIPTELRGTYLGFEHAASIDYLQRLGVTAVEFLPLHAFIDDDFLVRRKAKNYWGYKTLGFFAPEGRYSSSGDNGEQVHEFKQMVKALHAAGIEVILDVVYNHTAEGGNWGPHLSFRGIDNAVYYRLFTPERRFYEDVTGTGNTLNAQHPQVMKLIMDSLRYWVEEMHVDGFRFDLAPAISRENGPFSSESGLLRAIHQDPVLSTVKLIAEPWDLGPGGYQLGRFPNGWSEWNDRFRDTVRRFWRGDCGTVGELGLRLTGSPDIFQASQRRPSASINFVTAHDGFTLRDLVSYERKQNLANGELNRDGSDHNFSWNNGVEGTSDDLETVARRNRDMRNLVATLLVSRGVPMLLAGDEYGRTQNGNNNAYCQDNELSWISWKHSDEEEELIRFVRSAIALRRRSPGLRHEDYSNGQPINEGSQPDVAWYRADGTALTLDDWSDHDRRELACRILPIDSAQPRSDDDQTPLFFVINGTDDSVEYRLPDGGISGAGTWSPVLTTEMNSPEMRGKNPGDVVEVPGRTVEIWRLSPGELD